MKAEFDLAGRVFGDLTVLGRKGSLRRPNGKPQAMWLCRCSCGREVVAGGQKLRAGKKKSCCLNGHFFRINRGTSNRNERRSWEAMWRRCTDIAQRNYHNYGGRGIVVCDRWKDFQVFLEDMGRRPSLGHSIDRKDGDGNYEPGNCRWATKAEQDRNKRNNIYVEYEGEQMLLMDVVGRLGLDRMMVYGRLKSGWSLAAAISTPVRPTKKIADGRKRKGIA